MATPKQAARAAPSTGEGIGVGLAQGTLPFHRSAFTDLLNEDGLAVFAHGLGATTVLLKLIKLFAAARGLVVVLNAVRRAPLLHDALLADGVPRHALPPVVNSEMGVTARRAAYERGGVVLVSSRILITDMLSHRLPAEDVAGFLVADAHQVTEKSTESFVLKVYRKAGSGFVKAVSEDPEVLSSGFRKLAKTLTALRLRKVYLWPRFHASVVADFERAPEVVELQQQLTPLMRTMQGAIVAAIDVCLQQLNKTTKADLEDLHLEQSLAENFDVVVKRRLESEWPTLRPATRQLVSDLKTLRRVLMALLTDDCISFFNYLELLRTQSRYQSEPSQWLMSDAGKKLFDAARDRIFEIVPLNPGHSVPHGCAAATDADGKRAYLRMVLEENPRWRLLHEVILEAKDVCDQVGGGDDGDSKCERKAGTAPFDSAASGGARILVLARTSKTCSQIRDVLTIGGRGLLRRNFERYLGKNYAKTENLRRVDAAAGTRAEPAAADATGSASGSDAPDGPSAGAVYVSMAQRLLWSAAELRSGEGALPRRDEEPPGWDGVSVTASFLLRSHVVVFPQEASSTAVSVLSTFQPNIIVLYDPEPRFLREIEVYNAQVGSGFPVRVYHLSYENSGEEQRYLTTLKREKDAFEQLIREKQTLAIAKTLPSGEDAAPTATTGDSDVMQWGLGPKDTRSLKRMRELDEARSGRVIVDMREFTHSCRLPLMLHSAGLEVVPQTLLVGDYILTPDVCVERKSVPDLFSSFQAGRLFHQAEAMTRLYAQPILLIEFDTSKQFCLQPASEVPDEITPNNIISKLVILTLHFPSLRILWAKDAHAAVDLFVGLKLRQEEPDAETAAAVGAESEGAIGDATGQLDPAALQETRQTARDFLHRVPGVTLGNIRKLQAACPTLGHLLTMSEDALSKIIGSSNAALAYRFLHKEVEGV